MSSTISPLTGTNMFRLQNNKLAKSVFSANTPGIIGLWAYNYLSTRAQKGLHKQNSNRSYRALLSLPLRTWTGIVVDLSTSLS